MKNLSFLFLFFSSAYLFAQSPNPAVGKVFEASLLPQDAYVFYVIGDWGRKGKYNQRDVAESMNKTAAVAKPKFIASTGDNFYTFGVRNIKDKLWKKSFEDIYTGENIKDVDWYVALGNHDHYGNEKAQIKYSNINPHWKLPTHYHAFETTVDAGNSMSLYFINTEPLVNLNTKKTAQQWNWIDSSLNASTSKWKFVFGHHPVYSSNPSHGDSKALIEGLKPMLEKYKVPAYFCGHDHDLQHQQPKGSAVDYFVSGAGSKLRPSASYEHTLFAESIAGFALVAISGNTMSTYFIDKNGVVVYAYLKTIE
jgi:hypothetical protein